MKTAIETERKFLIKKPDDAFLTALEGCRKSEITQTYLDNPDGFVERVRRRVFSDRVQYTHTLKKRINAISATETESEITAEEYEELLTRASFGKTPVRKTRYAIPYRGHVAEIDVYPFWEKQAVLEIELTDESDLTAFPEWLTLLREVSGNHAYSNNALSERIPPED